jgi:hypothetical protein
MPDPAHLTPAEVLVNSATQNVRKRVRCDVALMDMSQAMHRKCRRGDGVMDRCAGFAPRGDATRSQRWTRTRDARLPA